jgi:glutamyl-tRNA reductase
MGGLAARAAARAGASVSVANRSTERAHALAAAVGGRATHLDPGADPAAFGAVIVAMSGPWRIPPSTANALVASRAVIVDLSFPAAILPDLAQRLGDRLISADRLAAEATETAEREGATADLRTRVDGLIDESVAEFAEWLARADARAAADALARHADHACEAELDLLWRRVPALDPEARDAIERMTRHLAARLLREPLERLGRDQDGRDGRAVRELFAL